MKMDVDSARIHACIERASERQGERESKRESARDSKRLPPATALIDGQLE